MVDVINILLVDDEPRNLDVLESILNDPTYKLLRADNADVALKLLLEQDVAAIVLDVKMPGVSGFELAQLIKGTKRFREIPILFLTAYHLDETDVVTGYSAGAVDYLTKPVNSVILRHKIGVFADLFRKTRALAELNEQLEARVRERTADLERASRMKDEFLATLSHEIRTPLSAMLGWSVMLQRTPSNEQKLLHGLSVIERNARAQERLITDLLDVSRIITGKLRFTMQRFRIEDPVHSAVEVVQDAATAKGVHLRVDIDLETGAMVGDAQRIQQVVWNLLVNAVRHTPADGVVTLTLQREGSAIVIRVKDTGEGIAPEHLPHVFERFHQVDSSSTRRHGGLGLGLAIVRHIVEAHGGTVEGTSEGQGCGSTFTVCLPVRAVDLEAPDRPSADYRKADEPAKAPQGEMPLLDVRVLVVDDDADSRDLIQALLEGVGATATTVGNASAALDAIERMRSFDVIVSDIGMPGEDGYTLIQRVRSAGLAQSVPAIALTAYARDEDARRALRSGFQAHLSKPVDPQKLVDAIGRLAPARHAPHGTEGAP